MTPQKSRAASQQFGQRVKNRARNEIEIAWHTRIRPRVERERRYRVAGQSYGYFYHPSHRTWVSERAVEVPVALEALERVGLGRVLEVGNVLTQYARVRPPNYTVVDKYERGAGIINTDVLDYDDAPFDLIVSVSTLEHIGYDEVPREPDKAARAIHHLRSLLAPGGQMLATWALNYNRDLDDALRARQLDESSVSYLRRRTSSNKWSEADEPSAFEAIYGLKWICGNAVAIVDWTDR